MRRDHGPGCAQELSAKRLRDALLEVAMAKKLRGDAQRLRSEALHLCRQLKLVWRRPAPSEPVPPADPYGAKRQGDEQVE